MFIDVDPRVWSGATSLVAKDDMTQNVMGKSSKFFRKLVHVFGWAIWCCRASNKVFIQLADK